MRASVRPGQQVELGRYATSEGPRVLVGRRIDGVVHVYDLPERRGGRRYFVESGFESCAELAVLVADYRRQAERIGACPMSPTGLEHIASGPNPIPLDP